MPLLIVLDIGSRFTLDVKVGLSSANLTLTGDHHVRTKTWTFIMMSLNKNNSDDVTKEITSETNASARQFLAPDQHWFNIYQNENNNVNSLSVIKK